MAWDRLLDRLAEVVPQVPTIGHLDRTGCSGGGALRVRASSITADHLHAGVLLQPVAKGLRLPIGEEVDGLAADHVDEHGAVDAAATEREVVHPKHRGRRGRRFRRRPH